MQCARTLGLNATQTGGQLPMQTPETSQNAAESAGQRATAGHCVLSQIATAYAMAHAFARRAQPLRKRTSNTPRLPQHPNLGVVHPIYALRGGQGRARPWARQHTRTKHAWHRHRTPIDGHRTMTHDSYLQHGARREK